MTRLQFAARLLELEANATMARAFMLQGMDEEAIKHLQNIHKSIDNLFQSIIDPSKTKVYLAK